MKVTGCQNTAAISYWFLVSETSFVPSMLIHSLGLSNMKTAGLQREKLIIMVIQIYQNNPPFMFIFENQGINQIS